MVGYIKLRYDGKYEWFAGEGRQWTIVSHFIDADGYDRYMGTFGLAGLRDIGALLLPNKTSEDQSC